MNVKNEIAVLCNTLKITEVELAKELGITFETINNKINKLKINLFIFYFQKYKLFFTIILRF